MKRLHISLKVANIQESIEFYNALFGMPATVVKEDYAKWMCEDPKVNFAISLVKDPSQAGVEHLGIQAETENELQEIYGNIEKAKAEVREEGHTVCCYSQSEKSWIKDPQGVEWEAFYTYGESATYYAEAQASDCCAPSGCDSEKQETSSTESEMVI